MASLFAICTTIEDTVADPDLQIRGCVGGGGGGKGWSSIREGPGLPKKYVWSKNKGVGGGGSLAPPLDLPQRCMSCTMNFQCQKHGIELHVYIT